MLAGSSFRGVEEGAALQWIYSVSMLSRRGQAGTPPYTFISNRRHVPHAVAVAGVNLQERQAPALAHLGL